MTSTSDLEPAEWEYLVISGNLSEDRWPDLAATRMPETREDAERRLARVTAEFPDEPFILVKRPKPIDWSRA